MLETMRKGANNIFVKAFLAVLAGFFVLWGVGDVFRSNSRNSVAVVGGEQISYNEYNNLLRNEIARYQQMLGGMTLTEEQIDKFGIKYRVLNQLVDNKIITKRAKELNVVVGTDAAQGKIMSADIFLNEEGKFDKEKFESILRSNGINKDSYIESLQTESAVDLFLDTMAVSPVNLAYGLNTLYNYRNESRVADIAIFPKNYVTDVAEPSESELLQYYNDNQDKFSIEETRSITYTIFNVADVKKHVAITDEDIKNAYDAAKDNYRLEEQRDVVQYLFDSEEQAKIALESIKSGKSSDYKDKRTDLGKVTPSGLPESVSAAVFKLAKGEYSDVVKSEMGFHIFTVNNIIEGRIQSFDEVKSDIKHSLIGEKSAEIFFETANKIEDDFAAGTPIEEVAKKFELKTHKVESINKSGSNSHGEAIKDLPEAETFVQLAFETDAGASSPLTLLSDNVTYIVLHVDEVSPARVKALDEVKGTAVVLWKENKSSTDLAKIASDFAEELKKGGDIAALAKAKNIKIESNKLVTRPESKEIFAKDNDGVPAQLADELFKIEKNASTSVHRTEDGNFAVAVLKDIKPAEVRPEKISSLKEDLRKDFTEDVLMQYNIYLRKLYPVELNKSVLGSNQ